MTDEGLFSLPEERELLGYVLIKDDFIKCANCGKKLLQIVKVKELDIKNYFIVKCPYCGDKSYKYEVSGKIYAGAAEGLVVSNCDTDVPTHNVFVNIMEVKKDV